MSLGPSYKHGVDLDRLFRRQRTESTAAHTKMGDALDISDVAPPAGSLDGKNVSDDRDFMSLAKAAMEEAKKKGAAVKVAVPVRSTAHDQYM